MRFLSIQFESCKDVLCIIYLLPDSEHWIMILYILIITTCVCVCVSGEPVPRSLEGLFVYEERSTSPPANDTIVVEQWTVIEVSNRLMKNELQK